MSRSVRPLVLHALVTVIVCVVVAGGAVVGARRSADQDESRTASRVSTAIIDPLVPTLALNNFASPSGFDRSAVLGRLKPFLRSGSLSRFKLWIVEGGRSRIVVSDEPRIEGFSRPADTNLMGHFDAGLPPGHKVPADSEHRYEATDGQLLEVFIGFHDAANNLMSLEAYVPVDSDSARLSALLAQVLPALLAVLVIGAATTPLTVRLTKRAAERRTGLALLATTATDRERRELAQRLHDGPIQDLAAASVALSMGAPSLSGSTAPAALAHELVRDSIRHLRTLSEEILPLSEADTMSRLPAVLTAIVPEPITLALSISVSPGSLTAEQATLITRVARELVRNAVHHAGPTTITVALDTTGPVTLTITDNGAGFDTSRPRPPGHLGLLLIDQLVADAQGTFTLYSHPTQGTEARIRLPTTPHHPVPR